LNARAREGIYEMHAYDDETVKTAAAAFREALYHVEGHRNGVPITQHAANLAVAIGITSTMARGQTSHLDMLVSGLNHMAVAFGENSQSMDTEKLPAIRTAEHYAVHAHLLRAMAHKLRDNDCGAALDRCAKTFDRIARSQELVAASMLRLCQHADEDRTVQ